MPTSISIRVFLSLLLVVCFNSSTFGESLSGSYNTQPQPGLNDTKINILFLSIVNDMPPGSRPLYFVSSFQKTQYLLEPGKPYTKLSNFEIKTCTLVWTPLYCAFDLYNPATEGDHQRIFWSVRRDGIYHSWDNANWDKGHNWESD